MSLATLKQKIKILEDYKASKEKQQMEYPLNVEDTRTRRVTDSKRANLVLVETGLQTPILFTGLIGLGLGVKYFDQKAYLYAMRAIYSFTVNPGTDVFTSSHPLQNGDRIALASTGTLPTGVDTITYYTVTNATATTFKLSGVNVTDTGSGTHYFSI